MADIRKIEDELWEAADELRANSKLTSQQYCMPVLGLIFLRYAWGRFKRANAQIDEERSRIEGRKPPKEPQDYTAKGAMFIPEEARCDYLLNLPAQADAGRAVNAAMDAIAKLNPSLAGVLPNTYTELGNDLLASVIRIFNNPALDEEGDDIIGRIYEYFLGKFAPAVASDDGVFFTPKSLVRMIMNVIEPARGTMLDPACGSGGMFVSASDYVRDHGGNPAASMMFYGQEKVDYNAKLCLMNMAVHGMQGIIKSGDAANTFYHDAHALDGKCDYVAANPPFNVDKVKWSAAVDAGRLPLGTPKENKKHEVPTSGANYLWINYFYSYLNDHGRAGFVMASSATDSNAERAQRRALVEAGAVDVMLYVGNNFFYTKSLPCTLWFLDKDKPQAIRDKVLFIDAQRYHTAVSTTLNEWTPWQLKNLSAIVWLYRGETQKYRELLGAYRARCAELTKLFAGQAVELLTGIAAAGDFALATRPKPQPPSRSRSLPRRPRWRLCRSVSRRSDARSLPQRRPNLRLLPLRWARPCGSSRSSVKANMLTCRACARSRAKGISRATNPPTRALGASRRVPMWACRPSRTTELISTNVWARSKRSCPVCRPRATTS